MVVVSPLIVKVWVFDRRLEPRHLPGLDLRLGRLPEPDQVNVEIDRGRDRRCSWRSRCAPRPRSRRARAGAAPSTSMPCMIPGRGNSPCVVNLPEGAVISSMSPAVQTEAPSASHSARSRRAFRIAGGEGEERVEHQPFGFRVGGGHLAGDIGGRAERHLHRAGRNIERQPAAVVAGKRRAVAGKPGRAPVVGRAAGEVLEGRVGVPAGLQRPERQHPGGGDVPGVDAAEIGEQLFQLVDGRRRPASPPGERIVGPPSAASASAARRVGLLRARCRCGPSARRRGRRPRAWCSAW